MGIIITCLGMVRTNAFRLRQPRSYSSPTSPYDNDRHGRVADKDFSMYVHVGYRYYIFQGVRDPITMPFLGLQ